jgi:hypothetical protein
MLALGSVALGVVVSALAVSPADDSGRFTVSFDPGPIAIYRADGYQQWDHVIPLPAGTICEVRTFVGWDRGSIGEASFEINVGEYRLVERSEHKESPVNYDAWVARTERRDVRDGELANMHVGAVQTAPNAHDSGLSTRVHFAFRLQMNARGVCD